jgi:hypothetical protein
MNFPLNAEVLWSSDWNGYECGYPEVNVVGLYTLKMNPDIHFYINMETFDILESWYICGYCEAKF